MLNDFDSSLMALYLLRTFMELIEEDVYRGSWSRGCG